MAGTIRRDPAMGYVGRATALVFVSGLFFLNVAAYQRARALEAGIDALGPYEILTALGVWLPVLGLLAAAAFGRRAGRLDMASPIGGQRLWTSHTLGLAVAGLVSLGATLAAALLVELGVDALLDGEGPRLGARLGLLALRLACVVPLLAVLLQSIEPRLSRLSLDARHVVSVSVVLALGLALPSVLNALHPAVALGLPVLAILIARAVRGRVGTCLDLAPWHADLRKSRPRGVPSSAPGGYAADWERLRGSRTTRVAVAGTVLRTITKMPLMPIIGVPLLLGFGVLLSGFARAWSGGGGMRFTMLPLTAYMLLAFAGYPPRRLYLLDGLPISRRAVFAAIVVLPVALLSVGYAGGRLAADRAYASREVVELSEFDGAHLLRVPVEYCEISRSGAAPSLESPWGETAAAWTKEIVRGRPAILYSPFSTDEDSSIDFVALQLSRAVEAVYGARVPPEEIRERYLEVSPEGRVRPRGPGLTVRRDYGLRPRPLGPVYPLMMLVAGALWFLAMTPYFVKLRADVPERTRKSVYWIMMLGLLGLHLAHSGGLLTGRTSTFMLTGFWEILIRRSVELIPGGSFTIWILCAAALVPFYRIAERYFLRIESTPGDDRHGGLIGGAV